MRRTIPTRPRSLAPTRGAAKSEERRAPRRAPEDDELTRSAGAHDHHFLDRTLRCEGEDLDRAARLYHHGTVVRQALPQLFAPFPDAGRAAIRLREHPPSPHVIITRGGAFVTCLAEDMSIRNLPVLPYAAFLTAMDRADREVERSRVRREQLRALPWVKLYEALLRGPGHISREQIRVFDRDPETYELVVGKCIAKEVELLRVYWKKTSRAGRSPRIVESTATAALDRVRLCTFLMGRIHTPYILDLLCAMMHLSTGAELAFAAAVARHPGGFDRLLHAMTRSDGEPQVQRRLAGVLNGHCLQFPDQAQDIARRMLEIPLLHDGWEMIPVWAEMLLSAPADRLSSLLQLAEEQTPKDLQPGNPAWIFNDMELLESLYRRRPASDYFPLAADLAAVKAAHEQRLREVPEWEGYKGPDKPFERGARVGRNEPCPCQSGRKFKQCCLGKPVGPTKEELEAQAVEERQAFVRRVLAQGFRNMDKIPYPGQKREQQGAASDA